MELIKNVEKATPFSVADQVQYESGKVVSLTPVSYTHLTLPTIA